MPITVYDLNGNLFYIEVTGRVNLREFRDARNIIASHNPPELFVVIYTFEQVDVPDATIETVSTYEQDAGRFTYPHVIFVSVSLVMRVIFQTFNFLSGNAFARHSHYVDSVEAAIKLAHRILDE